LIGDKYSNKRQNDLRYHVEYRSQEDLPEGILKRGYSLDGIRIELRYNKEGTLSYHKWANDGDSMQLIASS
jgi:hypothetical protein